MQSTPEPEFNEDGFRHRGAVVTRAEAFFDAAFAFAITLMVISIDVIPDTAEKLTNALMSIPAFGASFLLIVLFWRGHADWSKRFGLDDRHSQRLSLVLVFLVLIFIYPLRMVFSSFFQLLGGGWLPAQIHLKTVADARLMFVVFALGIGSMGAAMALLYRHAWRLRESLGLNPVERLMTRHALLRWAMLPVFSLVSLGLSAFVLRDELKSEGLKSDLLMSTPGLIFFVGSIVHQLMDLRMRRARRAMLDR